MSENSTQKLNLKMVIVCMDQELTQELARGFEGAGVSLIAAGTTAMDALALVAEHDPDLLIMDPYLSGMNCDELAYRLEMEAKADLVKMVVAVRRHDLLADRFFDNGGDIFRLLPIDYRYTVSQILRYQQMRRRQREPEETFSKEEALFQENVIEILKRIGMPFAIKGYRYIRYGALLCKRHPDVLQHLMIGFYGEIARHFDSSSGAVERCMRTAIEKACTEGEPEVLNTLFHLKKSNGKVENGEFMLQLLDLCRTDR